MNSDEAVWIEGFGEDLIILQGESENYYGVSMRLMEGEDGGS